VADVDWDELAAAARVEPGAHVRLARDFDPDRKQDGLDKAAGVAALEQAKSELAALQDRFAAAADRALLIVLQAIDAAGKDGTIKHVMSGLNPQGVSVHSFKAPSTLERSHDYLWRHQVALPELGRIAVFNRSHYENVLVTRVHPELVWPRTATLEVDDHLWERRYREINDWERHLTDNGTVVVKLFLHLSHAEQSERLLARIDDPDKHWKFETADLAERARWDDYQRAFDEMLSHTSTAHAPWHVVPSDRKWFSRLTTFAILLDTLRDLDPQYPEVDEATRAELALARREIAAEP
jgi:PPK2 family polyphosphate:nucleotide phosphotransferase